MNQKSIGYSLIVVGFLAASYATLIGGAGVNWTMFLPTFALSALGVAMVRIVSRKAAVHADTVASNIEDIDVSLARIVEKVAQLNRDKESIDTYDMRHRLDELLLDDLNMFVDARETIATKYGLHEYADVMSHFAAGERYLNRVWSCSADGYIDEVHDYIARAEAQFVDTRERFQRLRQAGA